MERNQFSLSEWQVSHKRVILEFLMYLNSRSSEYILKGGTALMLCYGLDRFSEDIDLDSRKKDLLKITEMFCQLKGCTYRIAKDTDTVKRVFINYGDVSHPLKIEVSRRNIEPEITIVNDVVVYSINTLAKLKANAFMSRDKVRDLFDISFIWLQYRDSLSPEAINDIRRAILWKDLDVCESIIETQPDPLINKDVLVSRYLEAYMSIEKTLQGNYCPSDDTHLF